MKSDVRDLCLGCPVGRYGHSHVVIVINLSLGALGIDFSQEVVLKSRINWQDVRSVVAQMP